MQGTTTFSVPLTSTGGHSLDATFTVNIGPDSTITYSAPDDLSVAAGRSFVFDASGYVSAGSGYSVSCGEATGVDSSVITVAQSTAVSTSTGLPTTGTNCLFTVTADSSAASGATIGNS